MSLCLSRTQICSLSHVLVVSNLKPHSLIWPTASTLLVSVHLTHSQPCWTEVKFLMKLIIVQLEWRLFICHPKLSTLCSFRNVAVYSNSYDANRCHKVGSVMCKIIAAFVGTKRHWPNQEKAWNQQKTKKWRRGRPHTCDEADNQETANVSCRINWAGRPSECVSCFMMMMMRMMMILLLSRLSASGADSLFVSRDSPLTRGLSGSTCCRVTQGSRPWNDSHLQYLWVFRPTPSVNGLHTERRGKRDSDDYEWFIFTHWIDVWNAPTHSCLKNDFCFASAAHHV